MSFDRNKMDLTTAMFCQLLLASMIVMYLLRFHHIFHTPVRVFAGVKVAVMNGDWKHSAVVSNLLATR